MRSNNTAFVHTELYHMRFLPPAIAVATLSLGLAACAGPVEVVSASTDAVTVRHTADSGGEAERQAVNNCSRFGKRARLRSNHSEQGGGQVFTIYDCVL
jgi:hypothetical protein